MRRGFTLLELTLVVIILGVIAALAVPRISDAQERSRYASTWASLRGIASAASLYQGVWQTLPGDVKEGVAPPGMASFIDQRIWVRTAPIGGKFDWNNTVLASNWSPVPFWQGYPPSAGVARTSAESTTGARMVRMDRLLDDGNATQGSLRRRGNLLFYPMPE
jgi:prepilin-type N-terminal cleavage/methylation domain-containing protein